MESTKVKNYYNSFLHSRMLDYRLNDGNKRINAASNFIIKNITPNSIILEIGCGIGILTERISKKLKNGFIWACDISDQNIWYSKKTIKKNNIDFFVADILDQFNIIKTKVTKPIDIFVFSDVIEHLPKQRHTELFDNLKSISSANSKILLTFPSEYYQEYLKKNNPDELQIVDEVITISHINSLAEKFDYVIAYFTVVDLWMNNQYVHCIMKNNSPIQYKHFNSSNNIFMKIINKMKFIYRKNKYITKIFRAD